MDLYVNDMVGESGLGKVPTSKLTYPSLGKEKSSKVPWDPGYLSSGEDMLPLKVDMRRKNLKL